MEAPVGSRSRVKTFKQHRAFRQGLNCGLSITNGPFSHRRTPLTKTGLLLLLLLLFDVFRRNSLSQNDGSGEWNRTLVYLWCKVVGN